MPNETSQPDNKEIQIIHRSKSIVADITTSMLTGAICSGGLNFWDKGLYMSVSKNSPFLTVMKNLGKECIQSKSPYPFYEGCSAAIAQRSVSWGIYYFLQKQANVYFRPAFLNNGFTDPQAQFAVGVFAGGVSGMISNPITAIKSHLWKHKNSTFSKSAATMWNEGGIKPFIKGASATVGRDIKFAAVYEITRNMVHAELKEHEVFNEKTKFISNMGAACLATLASGPLNYVRTMQYDTPPNQQPPTAYQALRGLWKEVKKQPTVIEKAKKIQQRLRLGWGTARVAAGMAIGQKVFEYLDSAVTTKLQPK